MAAELEDRSVALRGTQEDRGAGEDLAQPVERGDPLGVVGHAVLKRGYKTVKVVGDHHCPRR